MTADALCVQCHGPLEERTAPRATHPHDYTYRVVVCSRQCGQKWQLAQEPPEPTQQLATQPEPGTEGRCGCACGGTPAGGRYLPGHDSKQKAKLRRTG